MKTLSTLKVFLLGLLLSVFPSFLNAQCVTGETLNTYCYDDGEVNVVAFEFCPAAGEIAQSEIIAGSFSTNFPANLEGLTVYEGASGSGTTGTIVLGPVDGDLTGTIITASAADLCLIFISNSNTFAVPTSCADGIETELQVCSESLPGSSVNFTAPDDLCIDDGIQTGLSGGTPTGGVYSGPGVSDDGNGMTYSFDPAAAGVGVHTLAYAQGGNSATDQVEVFAIPSVTFTAPVDMCVDGDVLTGLGGGLPAGGVYSGPGISDDGNGMTYSFNPGIAGLGVHTITYTEAGVCQATATDDIEVLAACGCPTGQTAYFYCGGGFENDVVTFEVCPGAGMAAQATITAGTYNIIGNSLTVYQGVSGSGVTGIQVFGPASGDLTGTIISGTIADNCLIFISNNTSNLGCQQGFETGLAVCGEDIQASVSFTALNDVCIDDGIQTGLGGGLPTGGVYSGLGVSDDGNGMTYSFDPSVAGVGVHTLTYTQGGESATDDVEVFAVPVVTFTALADLCLDEGIQDNLGGGMPIGGVYSGAGVTDDGNGVTYSFNPAVAGLGVHTITYTEGGVCMATATDMVEVTAACTCPAGETTNFHCYDNNETNLVVFEICPSAGEFAQADIIEGVYQTPDDFLTVYQGVSGSGTSGAIVFGPLNGNFAGTTIIGTTADACLIFVSNTGPVQSCADGLSLPLVVCGSSITSNIMFTALPDLSVNAGVQTGLSGGTPSGGVYSGPGVTDDGNGMTYTFDPAAAGVGVHTLTYTLAGDSATDDVEVFNLLPPSFSKSFNSNQIGPGGVSTLTFTINNSASGTAVTNLAFVDNLPAGVTIANVPAVVSACSNLAITAPAGGSTISVTDGALGAGEVCTISVNVTSNITGTHSNTTGDLTSSSGNSGTASANLQVLTNRPGFSKSFSPAVVNPGERSTLTFTFDNSANTVAHSNLTFTDNLPAGMTVASPSNASSSCTGGVITAVPGSSIISYTGANIIDASVAAGGTCTVTVDVIGSGVGDLENVTGDLTSLNNFFQSFNSGKASNTLEVLPPSDILLQKSFSPNPATPGGTGNLEFTITNLNRDFDATNISFTDDLSAVLAGLTATGTPLNNICGSGSQLSGTTMLTFTGGTIPVNSSCTFSVPIQIPAGATVGTYTNVTSNITADINGSTITGNPATENLYIANVPTFTKTFLNDPIIAGGTTTLEFTITNTSTSSTLTDLTFSDPVTDFISGTTVLATPANGSCGAGSIFFVNSALGNPVFQMTGGNIAPGASCTFTIDLLIPSGTNAGTFTNTTSFLSGTIDGGPVNVDPATDDLTVLAVPQLSKAFLNDPVNAGDIVDLEFTISYDEFATVDATNISFTDDLNAVIPGLAAVGLPMNVCGGSISGTTNLSFTGGTLTPGETCTFTVQVQVPAGVAPGSYTNTTSSLLATINGQTGTGNTATDDLEIGGINFTKEFLDDNVIPGETTTLRFTIDNTSTFDATNIAFSDNLGALITGMAAQAPLPTAPCGPGSLTTGTTFFIFFNGEVAAGTSCSFDVNVLVPASATPGTYTNVTSDLSATLDGVTRSLSPAMDDLTVGNKLITLSKEFTNDPVTPGGTVTVEYTLTNTDAANSINNISFTDDFDAALTGLVATGLPQSNVCGAGSQISGTGLLTFTGGSLAPGASCTFSVTLQTPAGTPYGTVVNSTTSTVTGDVGGIAVCGDAASDDLQFQSFQLTKSMTGPVDPGGTTTVTFTITNFDPSNVLNQITFSDDLDAFISGAEATALPAAGSCGSQSVFGGTSVFTFARGELGPGESCSFDITVSVPCGTAGDTYTNTTSSITGDGGIEGLMSNPASADLTVNSSSSASFTAPADLCLDAGVQAGLSGGTPAGGVYSGSGVTNNGVSGTYDFNPVTAGVGTHTLTYSFTDGNGCITTDTDAIEVFALPTTAFTALADLCLNAGNQVELGGGTPTGGVYSGTGVTDDGNGMSYRFNPATAGVGTHTITYSFTDSNGCSNSSTDEVVVFAVPTVSFTAPADFCIQEASLTGLGSGTPTGGVYSGDGVTDDGNGMTYSFNSGIAGVGTHTITYTFNDANGCSGSASDDVEVFANPTVDLNIPAASDEFCVDDASTTISSSGSPTGGVYSGTGVTDDGNGTSFTFNPGNAGVGSHPVTYTYSNTNGCSSSDIDNIVVNALPTVTFTALADLCLNDGGQNNLGGGTPTGGVYSGDGVTDDGNGMTYDFNPVTAGVGTHTLTYTFTDGNGCTNNATDEVQVFAVPDVMFSALADLCVDAGVQSGLGGGTPTGGVYSGAGVMDDGNGMTYSFNPATAGVGTHTITYTVGVAGCTDSEMDDVEVFAVPTVSMMIPVAEDEYCVNDATVAINLAGSPTGGVYSGSGVMDLGNGISFTFNPATAGVGTHTVNYTITDANGCSNSATDNIVVNALPVVTFTALTDLCLNDGVQNNLGGGTPTGGVYSGAGVSDDGNGMTYDFDPATAGVGTHILTYTFTDANGCTNSATDNVQVLALPTVDFTALADLCVDAGVQAGLGGGTPTGGIYSGTGVTDDGNGLTYSFNPTTAGVGTHTITYTVGVAGCTDSEMDDVEVFALPTVTMVIPAAEDEYCVDDATVAINLAGSPTGGVYSGSGVMDLGNGISFTFNPATAGVGTHTVTYTITDANGCSNSATDNIIVNALPTVTFTAPADLCIDAGVQNNLGGGSPSGTDGAIGVYSGDGVTDDGNGTTYDFDPADAGVGTHTITYTYTDLNGCTNTASDDVEVFALPMVTFTAPDDLCIDAGVQSGLGGGVPIGGVYSGTGITDDGNGMTYSFDPAAAGVGAHTITYSFTNSNSCSGSASDDIEVFALPTVMLSNPFDVCVDAGLQTSLGGGTPVGGVYSGTGVTDDGNGMTYTFDPSTAGVGTHDITYTFEEENCNNYNNAGTGTSFSMESSTSVPAVGDTISVAIIVDDFTDIISFQYSMNWDPSLLSFVEVAGFNLSGLNAGSFGANQTNSGILIVSWADPLLSGQTVGDGVSIFNIKLEVIGTSGAMAEINFSSVPTVQEVTQDQNGSIEIITNTVTFNGTSVEVDGTCNAVCSNSAVQSIEVFALPTVMFTAPADLCVDAGVQAGLGGGTPAQGTATGDMGVYSGDGVIDDGNGMTYSFDPTAAGVGTHTLTYTYTDENGCTNKTSDDIEVFALPTVSFTAPAPEVCIDDAVETGLGGGLPTGGVYSGTGVTDDGNGMTFSFDPTASAPAGGNVSVTYTFTNGNGCSNSASDDIFVDPVCCDLVVDCSNVTDQTISCRADLPSVDFNLPMVTDSCGDVTRSSLTIIPGNTGCPGDEISITRTYFLQDTDGNMAECMQTFTVISNVAPTIMCPAGTTVECAADISVDAADATATVECGTPSVMVSGPVINGDPDCPNTTYTYTYTVTDVCNRTASCDQVFTIQNAAPTIVAPADMTVECLSDISLDPMDATVTTSCTLGSNTVTSGPVQSGDSDCPGTTYTYTYTVTDDCGRMASDNQVFTIQNAAPTIVAPADMTVECLSDIALDPMDATVTASCSLGSNTVISGPVQSGDSDCSGTTYTYTYKVTDDCGRMASDDQVFTIQNLGPTITCPDDKEIECSSDIMVDPDDAIVVTSCGVGFNTVITGPVQNGQADCPGTTYTYTYTVTDNCGRTAECEQVFTIQNAAPVIICPADEVVTCFEDINADPNNLIVSTSCGVSFVAYVKQPLIEGGIPGCDGTVYTYIYKVIDACGRVSQCEQQFLIQNSAPIVSVPPGEVVDCFEDIEVSVDDVTVTQDCPGELTINVIPPVVDPGEVNCPGTLTYTYRVRDACNRVVEVTRDFIISDNSLSITAPADYTSECGGSPGSPDNAIVESLCGAVDYEVSLAGPAIIGTPGCPGSVYQYTYTVVDACGRTASDVQNITIQNEGPSIACPENLQIFNCQDGSVEALIEAWLASVTASTSCGSSVEVSNSFNGLNGYCIQNGFTTVNFFATDDCGRTAFCSATIIVADTEPPLIYQAPQEVLVPCNGVTQFIFDNWLLNQGGAEAIDGCWGNDITWSMNPSNPQLNCDGGPQAIVVEFIATDGCGNSSSVIGIFNTKVQAGQIDVSGMITTEINDPIHNVEVSLIGGTSGIPDFNMTGNSGAYGFPELEFEENLLLVPEKSMDPMNGVSTFDLIMIERHVLQIEQLDSPYKIIAADINRSGHISTLDLIHLRKLILQIDDDFQNNTSWRFIDADFVFPNPTNPFETAFPETYSLLGEEDEQANFIGVKIGDVNLNALANEFMNATDDRSDLDALQLNVKDRWLQKDQEYQIDVMANNFEQINGFQFTLNFDQEALDVVEILAADLIDFDDENYGLSKMESGAITMSWNADRLIDLKSNEILFTLVVTANQDLKLSDVLSISSEYTKAEAYQVEELMNVNLAFDANGLLSATDKFQLFQNQPNPFKETTMIGFNLPEAGAVSLEIYDVSGRLIYAENGDFAKGYNQIDLNRGDLPGGILYYQVNTSTDSDSKKMILMD